MLVFWSLDFLVFYGLDQFFRTEDRWVLLGLDFLVLLRIVSVFLRMLLVSSGLGRFGFQDVRWFVGFFGFFGLDFFGFSDLDFFWFFGSGSWWFFGPGLFRFFGLDRGGFSDLDFSVFRIGLFRLLIQRC